MRLGFFAMCAVLLALLAPAAADPLRNVRVQFAPGTSTTTMDGHIEGRELIDYRLNVRAGQMMHVHLASRLTGVYFNTNEPGKRPVQDAAFYLAATGGNTVLRAKYLVPAIAGSRWGLAGSVCIVRAMVTAG